MHSWKSVEKREILENFTFLPNNLKPAGFGSFPLWMIACQSATCLTISCKDVFGGSHPL
jgi:hypothetical protein